MIKLNFKVEENGAVKTEMPFWKDILKECSFRVEPSTATIQPYGSASFRVSLFRTGNFTKTMIMIMTKIIIMIMTAIMIVVVKEQIK